MAIKEAAAAELAEIWVMAPMISTVAETRSFAQAARGIGLPIIGVMIETPAAALQTELILAEVDFVSIGTNDLAQYAFAADRHSAPLAALNDPWQPALLRMIEMVTSAAARSNKPVGVCGEAAADPLAGPRPRRSRCVEPFDDATGARRGGPQPRRRNHRAMPASGASGLRRRLTRARSRGCSTGSGLRQAQPTLTYGVSARLASDEDQVLPIQHVGIRAYVKALP